MVKRMRRRDTARGNLPEARGEKGIALITVIAVLTALFLLAVPFALSMRGQLEVSVAESESLRARLLADGMIRYARASLRRGCRGLDPTPDFDGKDELVLDVEEARGLLSSGSDPGSNLLSVTVRDEQGCINVNSASPFLLGAVLGRSRLASDLTDSDTEIPVEDAGAFPPDGGFVWIEGEMIRYRSARGGTLQGCKRGAAPDGRPYSLPRSARGGTPVLDGRVIRLIEERISDTFQGRFSSLDEVRRLCETSELFFHPGEIEAVERLLTVNSLRDDEKVWTNIQRVHGFRDDEDGLPTIAVSNGRYLGAGTVVRLRDGEREVRALVARAAGRILIRRPDTDTEVPADILVLVGDVEGDWDLDHLILEAEARHPVNINTADEAVLLALLDGLSTAGPPDEAVSPDEALFVARRIQEEPVQGREDLLERILRPAEEQGELRSKSVSTIYYNALNSSDQVLVNGTAPIGFTTSDVYTIVGSCIRRSRAGLETARSTVTEVVQVADQKPRTIELSTQEDFEDRILSSRAARWMITGPQNVARFEKGNRPPSRFFMNRVRRIFASRERESEDGEDEGDVSLEPVRIEEGRIRTRTTVEHFDETDDPEGYDSRRGAYDLSVPSAREALLPLAFGFWFRPEGVSGDVTLASYGRDRGAEDRVTLVYRQGEGSVVLDVADPATQDPLSGISDVTTIVYPITLRDQTWYHFHVAVQGSKSSDVTLWVDGNPVPARPRLLTRLASSVQPGDPSLSVEDAEGFPSQGALRVGNEIILYSSRSGSSFSVSTDPDNGSLDRGARDTFAEAHEDGESVELLGYSNPLTSDLPSGGARLQGNYGLFGVAALDGKTPVTFGGRLRPLGPGIELTDTEIPLKGIGGGRAPMDAFGDSGYALVVSPSYTITGTDPRTQMPRQIVVNYAELVYYGSVQGNELVQVIRGMETVWIKRTDPDPAVSSYAQADSFLNENSMDRVPTYVIPVSLAATGVSLGTGGGTAQGYLDPVDTRVSERAQLDDEWICYDSIESPQGGGGTYFCRSAADVFNRVRVAVGSTSNFTQGGPLSSQAPIDKTEVIRDKLNFRGADLTREQDHRSGEEILPCFRVRGLGVGRDDWVTVITPQGDKDSHRVRKGRRGDSADLGGGTGLRNYVGLEENVARSLPSTIRTLIQGGTLPRTIYNRSAPQELLRLVKFPSGEMPRESGGPLVFTSRTDGSELATGTLDEVEVYRLQETAYVMTVPLASITLGDGDDEIEVLRADARLDDDGGMRADDHVKAPGSPYGWGVLGVPTTAQFTLPIHARDGGILRIGNELIAYREIDEQPQADPPLIVFKECIRGFLGTQKSAHSRWEPVVPIFHWPLAVVRGGASAAASELTVDDTSGFDAEGCLQVVNVAGERGELLHYTWLGDTTFAMPEAGDAVEGDRGGIFRGRYGTQVTGLASGDVVIQMPIRYWDRYHPFTDDPELSYYEASFTVPSGYFTRLVWDEILPLPHIDLRVLVRIDGRTPWEAAPLGRENGLFLFENPLSQERENRLDLQGDSVDIRFFVTYESGAFRTDFSSDSWKETARLRGLSLEVVAPESVIWREEE